MIRIRMLVFFVFNRIYDGKRRLFEDNFVSSNFLQLVLFSFHLHFRFIQGRFVKGFNKILQRTHFERSFPHLNTDVFSRLNYTFELYNMKSNKKKQVKPVVKEVQKQYVPKSIMPHQSGFTLVIGAKPNSKQSQIMEINDEYIGVAIAAPPKEGEANEELMSYLSQVLGVKKNTLYLDKGSKSRNKVVIVQNKELSLEQVYGKIEAEMNS